MTPDDRDRLRELAERATPGPWEVVGDWKSRGLGIDTADDDPVTGRAIFYSRGPYMPPGEADAAYIAAAHPQAILAILDDLRDAEAERDRLRATLEKIAPQDCFCQEDGRDDLTCPRCIATAALAPDPPAGT